MIKSSKDTRYAIDAVVTHDGVKFPCWSMPDLSSFEEKFGADLYDKVMQIIRLFLVIHLSQLSVCFDFLSLKLADNEIPSLLTIIFKDNFPYKVV